MVFSPFLYLGQRDCKRIPYSSQVIENRSESKKFSSVPN